MSAQPAPCWFTIKNPDGTTFYVNGYIGPMLVRNQAEKTMLLERFRLDPARYTMSEPTDMDLAFGQVAMDYCKPASAYQIPPEVLESIRRRDRLTDARVKLRHDMELLVSSEVPTSEAEADALDALIVELDHWLARCYELQRYEPKEEEE